MPEDAARAAYDEECCQRAVAQAPPRLRYLVAVMVRDAECGWHMLNIGPARLHHLAASIHRAVQKGGDV